MNGHYFVTCFWGYDPLRIKLCQQFCNRYPMVHLLQNDNIIETYNCTNFKIEKEGFIDYIMINEFIKKTEGIKSLTIIDLSLIHI